MLAMSDSLTFPSGWRGISCGTAGFTRTKQSVLGGNLTPDEWPVWLGEDAADAP
jgi:hypothetical protein